MLIGILAGLTTCALWGLTFVAPRAVEPFSIWDLAVTRYALFGLVSVLLMAHPRFRVSGLSRRHIALGMLLGIIGYVLYFLGTAFAVRLAGAAIPPLIIGTMPVLLAVIANWRDRSVPWRALVGPLLLIAAGVGVVNLAAIGGADPRQRVDLGLGALCAIAALAIWVIYGLLNAAIMREPDAPDALRWTGLQGIGAMLSSLLFLPLTSLGSSAAFSSAETSRFWIWALLMGVVGSWVATLGWVVASKRLPLALAAQLIVAETLFGLGYGFAFEARLPTPAEWGGAALQLVGVMAAIAVFRRKPTQGPHRDRPDLVRVKGVT